MIRHRRKLQNCFNVRFVGSEWLTMGSLWGRFGSKLTLTLCLITMILGLSVPNIGLRFLEQIVLVNLVILQCAMGGAHDGARR